MFRNCKKYKYIMFKNQFYQKIFRDEMKMLYNKQNFQHETKAVRQFLTIVRVKN